MAARAYGRETIATLPIDDDKDWKNREISNVKNLGVNEHITLLARGKKRNVYPALNRYDSETDGWYVSKDNNDIERKFWKDDFSVDSLPFYDNVIAHSKNYFTVSGGELVFNTNGESVEPEIVSQFNGCNYGEYELVFKINDPEVDVRKLISIVIAVSGADYWGILFSREAGGTTTSGYLHKNNYITSGKPKVYDGININDGNYHTLRVTWTPSGIVYYLDGSIGDTYSPTSNNYPDISNAKIGVGSPYTGYHCNANISSIAYRPGESYSDDFTSDTTERYQPVLGTVAYDDANKRMNVTTATGANGKASGRLKSYKFCEGSQIYDVLLPTGADGDFICLVTHATDPAMTNGIGVGLQSDGAGNWNLATLSGTTVTVGASSGLTDGKTARIEIEKDITGAYWYYIYDAAGTKPTTATGKLFTTLTEGYTGWYANGNSKTYAIENISIRAESIVGRTNVEVTEPFWFRDEFGEDSKGRLSGTTSIATVDTVNGELDIVSSSPYCYLPPKLSDFEMSFTITADWVSESEPYREISLCNNDKVYPSGYGGATFKSYILKVAGGATHIYANLWKHGSSHVLRVNSELEKADGLEVPIKIKFTAETCTFELTVGTVTGTYTDTALTFQRGYIGFGGLNGVARYSIKNLQISGTRVYNKPIHRGAMLETYHDGTQEVLGTTFIDDCQWDRSGEYSSLRGTWVHDLENGNIACESMSYGRAYILNSIQTRDLILDVELCANTAGILICSDGLLDSNNYYKPLNGIIVRPGSYSSGEYVNGSQVKSYNIPSLPDKTSWHNLRIICSGSSNTISVYRDGIEIYTTIIQTSTLYDKIGLYAYGGGPTPKFRNLQIIAVESSSTNGIAACIPPIGGGARYGEQEKVYKQLVNAAKFGEYKTTASIKTTNADAEAIEMYFKNITDTTNIAIDDTDTLAISLSDTNYAMSTKDLQLLHGDRNDTIEVSVRKTPAATEVSPACYITDLMILPKMEG